MAWLAGLAGALFWWRRGALFLFGGHVFRAVRNLKQALEKSVLLLFNMIRVLEQALLLRVWAVGNEEQALVKYSFHFPIHEFESQGSTQMGRYSHMWCSGIVWNWDIG